MMAKLTQIQLESLAAIKTAWRLRKKYETDRRVAPSQPQIFIANLLDIIDTLQAPEPAPAPTVTDTFGFEWDNERRDWFPKKDGTS